MATPSTSGTYNFQTVEVELLIREAFERIGILGELVEAQKLDSARRSINFLLAEWMNAGANLWTLKTALLDIIPGKSKYELPQFVRNILQVNYRTYTRQLGGEANSSSGDADSAFDGDRNTSCQQDAADGYISYTWDTPKSISLIGIASEGDYDGYIGYQDGPVTNFIFDASGDDSIVSWYEINPAIVTNNLLLQETGGNELDISELYFCNNVIDYPLSKISRYEYLTFPNKLQSGRPTIFYLDQQITPILYIWPVPTSYSLLQFSYEKMLEDIDAFTDAIEIPSRFYQALIWGLSYHLAVKFNPQVAPQMQIEYEKSYRLASSDDTEETIITINPDYSFGGC